MKTVFKNYGFVLILAIVFGSAMLNSCKKDNNNDTTGGKTDPGTIASSNLVAYFPLNAQSEEVTNATGKITWSKMAGAGSFVPGRRGNAYQGSASQAYLEYTLSADNPFKTMSEFSIAMWIKSPAITNGSESILSLDGGDATMGNLDILQEGGTGDSIDIKFYLNSNISPTWTGQDVSKQATAFLNDKWFHLVALYNKTTSTMELYANGKLVVSSIRYSGPKPTTGDQPLLGAMGFNPNMTTLRFGAWPQQIAGNPQSWMMYYNGMIDEVRIYNKALSAAEVQSLYNAELSQVNP